MRHVWFTRVNVCSRNRYSHVPEISRLPSWYYWILVDELSPGELSISIWRYLNPGPHGLGSKANRPRDHAFSGLRPVDREVLVLRPVSVYQVQGTKTADPRPASPSALFLRVPQAEPCRSPDNGSYPFSTGVQTQVHIWVPPTTPVRNETRNTYSFQF